MPDNGIRYLANTRIRDESASLQKELMEVELEIAAIKNTIYGLSVICGHELISRELLDQVRPVHRGKKPGLTAACRSVLASAGIPCSVGAVCQLINAADPSLLARQRNPLASVMTVLRNLAKKGEVVRKSAANGRSMWEWVALGRETQR
jgi:hypothetical protein